MIYDQVVDYFTTILFYPAGDFDELLEEPRFASIEKIKTCGTTYMAASGLNADRLRDRGETSEDSVCSLVEFAFAMKQKLEDINREAFNNFQLRVGICSGSLVSGVIGARKPVYDIWGNTVNVASRMDSTGENWRIQVPDTTAELLKAKGYTCVVSCLIFESTCIFFVNVSTFSSRNEGTLM